jgi:uncharacterized membrane protein (UPF0127 family)
MVRIVNRARGTLIAERAEVARTWWARGKGLLGKKGLPPGGGLIIEPCSSIHTWFMAFPIDVAFVAADGRVVRISPALKPWRFGPLSRGVRFVVELPAGALATSGTVAGDYLDIAATAERDERPHDAAAGARRAA